MVNPKGRVHRIGIDARMFRGATGGIGRYSRELIYHLATIDTVNQYTIFLTEADLPEWELTQPNFHPVVVKASHYTSAEQTAFLQALYKEKLDLVHFLNFNHPVLYRRPFVTTLHDLTLFHRPGGRNRTSLFRRMAYRYVFTHAIRSAKKVIAISEYTASDAVKNLGISHTKIEVIYEGRPETPLIDFGSKSAVQKFLGTREPYFLFVSQWREHKGIITLLNAFTEFKKKTGLSHKLVLVGNQQAADESVKAALVSSPFGDDVITPGFCPDDLLHSLYHHADVFVMPSEYEGFGLPIVEAFVCGTPVIAADNSSMTEIVQDAGLLFPTGDSNRLANLMEELVLNEDKANMLREKGLHRSKVFSWSKMAEKTLAVYQAVLEKQR
jgi:glycosyltransferase involved in cell wall biosynthesis